MEKNGLIQKLKVLGRVMPVALAVGCGSIPTKINQEIYQNPIIKQEYNFKVVNREGYVNERNPAYIKNGNLYVIGFSKAHSNERSAYSDSWRDALSRIEKLAGVEYFKGFYPVSSETVSVEKEGKKGYVIERLIKIALSNFDAKTQERIKQNVGISQGGAQ